MKKFIALALVTMMTFAFTACSSTEPVVVEIEEDTTAEVTSEATEEAEEVVDGNVSEHTVAAIQERGKIIIATESQYAPFAFKDLEGNIIGLEPTFMQAIADDLGVELEILDIEFTAVIPAVQSGAADFALAGLSPTPERAESVELTDVYNGGGQSLVVRLEDVEKYTTVESLVGEIIACQKGALQQTLGEEQFPESTLTLLTKVPQCVEELKAGNCEGVLMDTTSATMYVANNPELAISVIPVELGDIGEGSVGAVMKGNTDLLDFINEEIAKYHATGELTTWFEEAQELATELGMD